MCPEILRQSALARMISIFVWFVFFASRGSGIWAGSGLGNRVPGKSYGPVTPSKVVIRLLEWFRQCRKFGRCMLQGDPRAVRRLLAGCPKGA